MKDVMGIINLVEPTELLKDLTKHRTLGAVPIGGRYRLIDFALSNLVNAGIRNVGIFVQDQYRALMDHVGTGMEWDLARQRDGLFILPPDSRGENGNHQGDIDILYRHYDYLERSREKTVIMAGTSIICNMDYKRVVAHHQEIDADVTIVYKPDTQSTVRCTVLDVDDKSRVTSIRVNPLHAKTHNISMKMYILKKELLMELLDQCISRGETDFVKDALIKNIDRLKIVGYPFDGYIMNITSLSSYYHASMELLDPSVWQELFFHAGPIHTKVKNESPVHYGHHAKVTNSLIANGCIIEGTVENSILFRGVHVQKGVHVKNSILMQKSDIGKNATLEYVILDKDVIITKGKNLQGDPDYPMVVGKKTVL